MIIVLPYTGAPALVTVDYQDTSPAPATTTIQGKIQAVADWKITTAPTNGATGVLIPGLLNDIVRDARQTITLNGNQS